MEMMLNGYGEKMIDSIQPLLISNNIEIDHQDIVQGLESIEKILRSFEKFNISLEDILDTIKESLESLSSVEDGKISETCQRILKEYGN